MARPLRLEFKNAYYHVMSRGDRKDNVFLKSSYKKKFIQKMSESFLKYNVICLAFSVLNNHYHIFLKTPEGNLSECLRYLNSSYSNWYKAKTGKVGHVFQGRFRAIIVDSEYYGLNLLNYIHLNAVKANLCKNPVRYKFSSCSYYVGKSEKTVEKLEKEILLSNFSTDLESAEKEYEIFLKNNGNDIDFSPGIFKSIAIGRKKFLDEINIFLEKQNSCKEIPSTKMNRSRFPNEIFDKIQKFYGVKRKDIIKKKKGNIYRKIAIYLMKKYSRMTLREIGDIFSVEYSSISQSVKRFEKMISKDKKLKNDLVKIMNNDK